MLPSLNAGTFEGGRPQIVFERGIVIEPKRPGPGVCQEAAQPPMIVLELLRAAEMGDGCQRYPLNTSNVALPN